MKKFQVGVNGLIVGVNKRFHGGSGTPEMYETEDDREIAALKRCAQVKEMYTTREELEALDWDQLRSVGAGVYKTGMTKAELTEKLLRKLK